MTAAAEAGTAALSSTDVLDDHLGFLIEGVFAFYSEEELPREAQEFKDWMRQVVEGAASEFSDDDSLIRRFEELEPLELIGLAGLQFRESLRFLTKCNPGFVKTDSAKDLRLYNEQVTGRACRQFGLPSPGRVSRQGAVVLWDARGERRPRERRARASTGKSLGGTDPPEPARSRLGPPGHAGLVGVGAR